jgi:hypothetical protein
VGRLRLLVVLAFGQRQAAKSDPVLRFALCAGTTRCGAFGIDRQKLDRVRVHCSVTRSLLVSPLVSPMRSLVTLARSHPTKVPAQTSSAALPTGIPSNSKKKTTQWDATRPYRGRQRQVRGEKGFRGMGLGLHRHPWLGASSVTAPVYPSPFVEKTVLVAVKCNARR